MRNKKIVFISILLFMVVLSIGAISAEDVDDAIVSSGNIAALGESNTVSGGVDVATENPWDTSGELSYDIPSDAKTIKSADVYVNVYNGRADNTYGVNSNITITTDHNTTKHFEPLWIEEGSTDGTVYIVNDHTTKCYSDFMIHYDITDMLNGLNGTNLKINVETFEMEGKQFDGRIKLIALILAYDDGDYDSISYWINDDQLWTKQNVTVTFDTDDVSLFTDATLTNIVLSSGDGSYKMNNDFLDDADTHESGNYYQYNQWDVTSVVKSNQKNSLNVINVGTSAYGSIKNVLSILTINNLVTGITITPEYTSVPSAYAGTNNTLTVKVSTKKAGDYSIKLLADDVEVNGTEIALVEGENTILLTDPTIRDIDETTVNGAENNMVKYTVETSYNGTVLNSKDVYLPVLYNGNLGYDMEYDMDGFFNSVQYITGDVVIDIKDKSSYLGSASMTRTDVWAVDLDENSEIASALLIIPYNWFNAKTYNETDDMFDLTFNGKVIECFDFYRDQGNLGNYGKYGYGVLIYDVTDLLNASGDNTLVLNKKYSTPAVYPSVLFYAYNTPGGNFKEVHFISGADLLANSNNLAGRPVRSDINDIILDDDEYDSVMLYVLAAGAQAGEGNIIVNSNEFVNVWNGTSSTTDLFTADITNITTDDTNISFVATGSTILALPQFIVADVGYSFDIDSIKPEYTSVPTCYAGTNNTITVTVSSSIAGEFEANLWADEEIVDTIMVNLTEGTNNIIFTDPTIRPIDENTVNGADNDEVTYIVDLINNNDFIVSKNITIPVLYNGNLGYDMEYNVTGFEELAPIAVTGDVVIDIKDVSSYLGSAAMNRTDNWAISLNSNSKITNAFIYVPYNWFNAKAYTEDMNMFNAVFNGVSVTPVAMYRDQGNLGNYGKYGYGVLIYDVTDLIAIGDNSFVLNKAYPTPAVYPSVLIYMYNTTGSTITKTVNILNGADLLANSNNNAGRIVKADTEINVDTNKIIDATLYVLAASAQAGESDIVFNGDVYNDVWSGTSSTTNLFTTDVTSSIENANSISFIATGSTILELSQIIVTSKNNNMKVDTAISADDVSVAYNDENGEIFATLINNITGKGLIGANVVINLNGEDYALKTNSKGEVSLSTKGLTPKTYVATISYAGSNKYNPSTTNVNVVVNKASVDIIAPDVSVEYNYQDGMLVATVISEVTGKGLSGANVVINLNGENYTLKTNSKGEVSVSTKGLTPKTYTATITYKGNSKYEATSTTATVVVNKANVTLSALYDDDTCKLVATVTSEVTNKGLSGANIVINLDGTDYIMKTNGKGQASISTYGLAPGNYTVAVTYNGNSKYNPSSINVDISIIKSDTYISADDVSVAYNDAAGELVATLFNSVDYQGIAGAEVVISINDNNYTLITDDNGQVSVSTKGLTPNTYNAVISYAGDDSFRESKTEVDVVVTKASADIIAPDVSVEYNYQDGMLIATLISEATGKGLSGANVVINLNGVDYALKTNSKGEVSVSTKGLTPKTYVATITYNGNSKYEATSTTATVVINKANVTLSALYDEDAGELVATVTSDVTGKGLSGANIVVNINNVKYTSSTNSKGQAIFSISDLAPGNYTAEISYKGNAKYNPTNTTIDITI